MFHDDTDGPAANRADHAAPSSQDEESGPFEVLLAALDEALANGSTSPVPDLTSVPDALAAEVLSTQDCLSLLHSAVRSGQLDDLAEDQAGRRPAALSTETIEQIGSFRILRELGRGGYGIVFLACDLRLNREVALKVPRPEAMVTPELQRRFLREAEAAGSLHHANLIAVYEVGQDGPFCYIASSYCKGPTLAEWLAEAAQPTPCAAAVAITALAEGVDYAHRHGVLHRDIKPSNILLEPIGAEPQTEVSAAVLLSAYTPKLTDFGMAKLLERTDSETRSGMLLGTPAYMSPEQATGRLSDVCAATDVYGLGIVLYEMLAGRPPFRGASDPDTLRQVCIDEPTPLRRLAPATPRDLEAICLKCLDKKPSNRYRSASELALDLRRFQAGEPTLARPMTSIQRAVKWSRRRPALAALIAVSSLALLLMSSGGWVAFQVADARRLRAEESELKTRRVLYASEVSRALVAWEANDPRQARRLVADQIPSKGQEDLREFSWRYVQRVVHEEEHVLQGHTADVFRVQYSPDGNKLATASKDHTVRLWDAASGRPLGVLQGHADEVLGVAFSADGRRLASVDESGRALLWDVEQMQFDRELLANEGVLRCVAFSPDGNMLAVAGEGPSVRLWRTSDWTPLANLETDAKTISDLSFSAASDLLAAACKDGKIQIWEASSGRQLAELVGHTSNVRAVSFLPNGQQLVSASDDYTARFWDLTAIREDSVRTLTNSKLFGSHAEWLLAADSCPDNRSVVLGARDGAIRLVDIASRQTLRTFNGHEGRVWSVCVSPNGEHLATAGSDKTVRIWRLKDGASHRKIVAPSPPHAMYFASDRSAIVVPSRPYRGYGIDLRNSAVKDLALAPAGYDNQEWLDASFGQGGRTSPLPNTFGSSRCVALLSDGKILVAGAAQGRGIFTAKLRADGQLDVGFGNQGSVFSPRGIAPTSLKVQADAKIVVAGFSNDQPGIERSVLARYSSDGQPDETFSGEAFASFDESVSSRISGLAIQSDAKIVLAVNTTDEKGFARMSVSRLLGANGAVDSSFGNEGKFVPLTAGTSHAWDVVTQIDDKILVAGSCKQHDSDDVVAVRLTAAGRLDPEFGQNGVQILNFDGGDSFAYRLKVLPDGKILIAGGCQSESVQAILLVRLTAAGQLDPSFKGVGHVRSSFDKLEQTNSFALGLDTTPDGKILVGGHSEGPQGQRCAFVRYLADGEIDQSFGENGRLQTNPWPGIQGVIADLLVQPDGRVVAVGMAGGTKAAALRLMPHANNGAPLISNDALIEAKTQSIVAIAQRAGVLAVAFPRTGIVSFQSFIDGRELASIHTGDITIENITLSSDGRRLAVVSDTGKIQMWEVASREVYATLPAGKDPRKLLCFSPDGQRLAFVYDPSDQVAIWDVDTADARSFEQSVEEDCNAISFSPSGRFLATASGDRLVKLWDVSSGRQAYSLSGHTGHVLAIAFSPDERTLATGSDDRTIKLWDLSTLQQLATLHGHQTPVVALYFRPDNEQLVSVGMPEGEHAEIHIWSAMP